MKFVLVNGRTPDAEFFCASCRELIGESYLRELATRFCYCGPECFGRHLAAARAPKKQARASQQTGTRP